MVTMEMVNWQLNRLGLAVEFESSNSKEPLKPDCGLISLNL